MIDPEKSYPIPVKAQIVFLANDYPYKPSRYEYSPDGYQAAVAFLNNHQRTLRGMLPGDGLRNFIVERGGISNIAGSFAKSLRDGDPIHAFYLLNPIYFCGEADRMDGLGGMAETVSLLAHRAFQAMLFERFARIDPILIRNATALSQALQVVRGVGGMTDEIMASRVVIHSIALNGTLGFSGFKIRRSNCPDPAKT